MFVAKYKYLCKTTTLKHLHDQKTAEIFTNYACHGCFVWMLLKTTVGFDSPSNDRLAHYFIAIGRRNSTQIRALQVQNLVKIQVDAGLLHLDCWKAWQLQKNVAKILTEKIHNFLVPKHKPGIHGLFPVTSQFIQPIAKRLRKQVMLND